MVNETEFCGEWADADVTAKEAERQERVRQFALAIVQGWYASDDNIGPDFPQDAWKRAAELADYEGQT